MSNTGSTFLDFSADREALKIVGPWDGAENLQQYLNRAQCAKEKILSERTQKIKETIATGSNPR